MARNAGLERWVCDWISSERAKGRKDICVRRSGNVYNVYSQTKALNTSTRRWEKTSVHIGRLTTSGIEEAPVKEPDITEEMRFGLGVDTGGTFTDAVIVDLDDYSIIAKRKSQTTHRDLSVGLHASVDAVLEESGIDVSQIASVGISTTLATNSVLEKKGGKVGLILIGWDPVEPVHFGEDRQIFIKGGYDVRGRAKNSLSLEETTAAIKEISQDVDAIAISGLFANLNASQERKVKKLASELTGLPTVAGHELTSELGIGLRAETAVLNGKLISIVSKFFDDVKRTFESKGIMAPIMVYRGDGSVMTLEQAKLYPVQTILSGPAASSMGGRILSGREDFVMVDIGGTSTDIAVVEEGYPQIQFKGAEVGGWRTRVKAVDMHTVALGGDSRISVVDQRIVIGPNRVVPLCRLAERFPEIKERTAHSGLWDYHILEGDVPDCGITERQARILRGMEGKGPMNRMDIMNSSEGVWDIDGDISALTGAGILTAASLTPTDVMVYLGMFDAGDVGGSAAGITVSRYILEETYFCSFT